MTASSALRAAAHAVALIAPAGGVADELIDGALQRLATLGVRAHLCGHARDRHRYLAGTWQSRLEDLYEAYETPGIDAVWCLRGGYGSAQLLPHIDWERLRRAERRPLIGFSDISHLLTAFHQRGLPVIHGPVAAELGRARSGDLALRYGASLDSIGEALAGAPLRLPARHVAGDTASREGYLIGGNLTCLAAAAGTGHGLFTPAPSILLIEDVGELWYRLERSFWQLLSSLNPQHLSAVCLGTFTDCPRKNVEHELEEIVLEWLRPLAIPLYADVPVGHGPDNLAWRYGQRVRLDDTGLRSL